MQVGEHDGGQLGSSWSGTPAAGVKNAASGGSHGGFIWPSLITAQLRRPTANGKITG
jgi:hypothetical protein